MSSVRFIAKAFRAIVEAMNWVALAVLVLGIIGYVFNRDAMLGFMGQYGIYADGMMLLYVLGLAVSYILVMGVLCVFLEIYASLDRLAQASKTPVTPALPSNSAELRL